MSVEVICPDCGGAIGGATAERPACSCYVAPAARRIDNSDTAVLPADLPEPASTASESEPDVAPEKRCLVCGKDVVGHRRIKDSRGYTCYECAKAERADEVAGKIRCTECKRLVKEAGLVPYNGQMICRKCYNDHQEMDKHKPRAVPSKQFDKEEKRNIVILAVVVGILGLIVIWRTIMHHL